MLAVLALSQGVPMLSHGDELGRTQLGNNNAYCHDGPLTWVDWTATPTAIELRDHVRALFRIRAAHPGFRLTRFADVAARVEWIEPRPAPPAAADDPALPRACGFRVAGPPAVVVFLNGEAEPVRFALPGRGRWRPLLPAGGEVREAEVELEALGVAVFEEVA